MTRGSDHSIVQLRITLSHIDPPVWRRVQIPADYSLRRVHDVIQAVFSWLGYHLHQFEVGDKVYGQAEIPAVNEFGDRIYSDKNVKLGALIDRGVQRFIYRYDFGDDWEHVITVEAVSDRDPRIDGLKLLDGARAAPPEDCGGPYSFAEFVEAIADDTHEAHADLLEWYGGPFDPNDMNLVTVEAMLDRIRASRRKGPAKGTPSARSGIWVRRS